jgi:hypothetical protein
MSEDTPNERLVRIETKLDMVLSSDSDKEARIRALEKRLAYVLGACAVVSAVVPIIVRKMGF